MKYFLKIIILTSIIIITIIVVKYIYFTPNSGIKPFEIIKNNYSKSELENMLKELPEIGSEKNINENIILKRGYARLKLATEYSEIPINDFYKITKTLDSADWQGPLNIYLKALKDFDQVLKYHPDNAQALLGKGIIYLTLRQTQKAETYFNKSIKFDNSNSLTFLCRGDCMYNKDLKDSAFIDYNKAKKLDPNYWRVYYNLAFLASSDSQAANYFNKAFQLGCRDTVILGIVGIDFITRKKYSKALFYYCLLQKKYPQETSYLENLALIHKKLGMDYLAIRNYKKLLKVDSNYVWPIYEITKCYANLKRYDKVNQYMDKYLNISNSNNDNLNEIFKKCESEAAFKNYIKIDEYLILKKKYLKY